MLTKNIVNQPKSVVEVQINLPWADVENQWNQTLQKLTSDLELPGFRKGQVPQEMAEQNLGGKIQEEFFKAVMPQALVEALQGTNITPIDYPTYQLVSFSKGQPLVFKAVISQRPAVKVGDYKSIKVSRPPLKTITEEDMNKVVEDLYKRWRLKNPAPAPQAGPAGTGSMSFSSGTSGLVDAQGNPISGQKTDGANDDFAKAIGAQSLVDLKSKIRTDLEAEVKFNNELDFEEAILQEVEKITQVEVPDILVQDELNRMLVSLQRRVADMGLLLEDYLKGQNETVESLKAKWRPQAEKNVRMELGLAEIGRLENIQISDEEVQAEVDKIQDARLKAQFEAEEPRLHLKHSLRQVKTLDLLKKLLQSAIA